MLSKKQIQQALHASRVVPLPVTKPHDPLGLEQLAAVVSRINPGLGSDTQQVRRLIVLDQATWEKLNQLAATTAKTTSQHITASQVATAIIEQFIATLPQQDDTRE